MTEDKNKELDIDEVLNEVNTKMDKVMKDVNDKMNEILKEVMSDKKVKNGGSKS